jgi:Tol biopolymer transport system component
VYYQRADGTGSAVRLTESAEAQLPDSISPDGRVLVIHQGDPATSNQVLSILPLDVNLAGSKPTPVKELVGGRFLKANARISPDGKWIAYAASYSGRFEIYVQPFPGPGDRVQVSNGGGNLAVWSKTRSELYYVGAGSGRLSIVPYTVTGNTFSPAKPQLWSETRFSGPPPINTYGPSFDIHPDGQRFAVAPMPAETGASGPSQVVLFYNFFDELRRVAPVH